MGENPISREEYTDKILSAYRRTPGTAGTIRSLAYFLPVIEEVLNLNVSPGYFQHLRAKIERVSQTR